MAIGVATSNPGQVVTREAGANVTKRRFVKDIAGGKVDRTGVQGEKANGVSARTVATGDEVPVQRGGIVQMEAGAAIGELAEIMTDNQGRPITAAGSGAFKLGKLTNGSLANAAGDQVSVELYLQPVVAVP